MADTDWTRRNNWPQRFAIRRERFLKTIAERLSEIDELIAAAGNVPRESLIKVCHHLHQMVAGCGIYELSELCNLTVEAEELCKRVLRGPSGLAPEQEKSLRRLLHDMKCIVER